VPVLALSQLSRESERRENKRPQLSDLRDSGCLVGSTPVFLPDEGCSRPIATLVGASGLQVLALDTETWKLVPRTAQRVFATGHRPVFDLTTQLGRQVRATANHRFLTPDGWKRLDGLTPGDHMAMPRALPSARSGGAVESPALLSLASGDADWDPVASIQPAGHDDVFDLPVAGGPHNFVAGDVIVHNSIEQDADVVLFLYREGMHKQEVDKSRTQLIVSKNRNGPTDEIPLVFIATQTAFREPFLETD